MAESILVNGLITSGVYALLAVGFSLIFGVARIVNLAHTAFYMLAAYLVFTFTSRLGLPIPLSICLSVVSVAVVGMLSYQIVIDRLRGHEATILIATIAIALIIQESMLLAYGSSATPAIRLITGYQQILGVKVFYRELVAFGVAIILLAVTWAILMKTRLGIAIRSTAQDREIANLMGINVTRTGMITMGIALVLAAIAGAVVESTARPFMWMSPLVTVLAIVVLGGLGSIKGSFIAAFILGFVETIVTVMISEQAYLKEAVALAFMLAVILMRPEGLFGVRFEEER